MLRRFGIRSTAGLAFAAIAVIGAQGIASATTATAPTSTALAYQLTQPATAAYPSAGVELAAPTISGTSLSPAQGTYQLQTRPDLSSVTVDVAALTVNGLGSISTSSCNVAVYGVDAAGRAVVSGVASAQALTISSTNPNFAGKAFTFAFNPATIQALHVVAWQANANGYIKNNADQTAQVASYYAMPASTNTAAIAQ